MERHYLTNQEIDNICRTVRDKVIIDYPMYSSHINFMYEYGCRINELFNFRISYDATSAKVIIQPQKKNNLRIFNPTNFETIKWIEDINLSNSDFHFNKRNLQRIIEKCMPVRILMCGNKKIGAHLFRHNYVKKQYANGKQIKSIDADMGYTWQTIASTYLISKIYYLS